MSASAAEKRLMIELNHADAVWIYQILLDRDPEEALAFLRRHLRKPVERFLQGGCREALDRAQRLQK